MDPANAGGMSPMMDKAARPVVTGNRRRRFLPELHLPIVQQFGVAGG
jgi:hypothetical protein